MAAFFPRFRSSRSALLAAAGVLLAALILWFWGGRTQAADPLLTTPMFALEGLQAKALYFNSNARPWLLAHRPDLLTAEDRDEHSERARGLRQAVQNPKLFRQLDRQYRFDAVALSGDPSQFKPLLDHLVATKDWTLRAVDHTTLIFRRDGGPPWQAADLTGLRARLAKKSAAERATALAQTATKLLAAGRAEDARQLLDEAAELAPRNPEVANARAIFHLGRAEWREAAAQVERALAADRKFLPALATKTQLLYGTKNFSAAYEVSRQLIAELPEDPNLLFYHAKIAHEAHAFTAEINALEKLIARALAEGQPVGGFQLYLGQAYASKGDATRSIDSFMLALNDADLPDDQRAFARENIARIKKRTGL